MKYYGFWNVETGVTDVRAYDPANDADDPWFGKGDSWNGVGSYDTYAEAEGAAMCAADSLRCIVIRDASVSPAYEVGYAIIGIDDTIPEGWFVKATFHTCLEAENFIRDSAQWCRWNGIGWVVAEKDATQATSKSDAPVCDEGDDDLLSPALLARIDGH